jgi:hypothetical protein
MTRLISLGEFLLLLITTTWYDCLLALDYCTRLVSAYPCSQRGHEEKVLYRKWDHCVVMYNDECNLQHRRLVRRLTMKLAIALEA